ncbi:MAG TPA: phosphodiester glycosidase family protein [Longimicrobium sp.]
MSTDIGQVDLGAARHVVAESTQYFFSGWKPIFQGVDRAVGTADLAFGFAHPVCRKQNVNVVRVFLGDDRIRFLTTSSAPPIPYVNNNGRTISRTISEFLSEEENAEVVLAVNANFSYYTGSDVSGKEFVLFGAAVRDETVVCDPALAPWTQDNAGCLPCNDQSKDGCDVPGPGYAGAAALLIREGNRAEIVLATAADPVDLSDVHTAIAGSAQPARGSLCPQPQIVPLNRLLWNGHNQATPQEIPEELVAGRTAVGLGVAEGVRYLYLMTLDGREGDAYPYGAGFYDLGEWMKIAGATDAIPLDGGGSSVMAWRAADGTLVHAGVPYGDETTPGVERAVGNFFGVIAPRLGE